MKLINQGLIRKIHKQIKKIKQLSQKNHHGGDLINNDEEEKNLTIASDNDYDNLDNYKNVNEFNNKTLPKIGGTRKIRISKKLNGHKFNCSCPICKNIRKNKKTYRHKKHSHKRH